MSIYCPTDPPELASVLYRIRKKREDYDRYSFSHTQARALWAFFDLAQEYETLDNFYRVCVFVPKEFMGFDSCLYLIDRHTGRLQMACDSLNGLVVCGMDPPEGITISDSAYESGDSFVAPIKGNRRLIPSKSLAMADEIIGVFEVFPRSHFEEQDRLFFEKYANRIGYNLHYKLLAIQNEQHLKFINTLVADIEHNVIVPNLRYKVFLNHFKRKLQELDRIDQDWSQALAGDQEGGQPNGHCRVEHIRERLSKIQGELLREYEEVDKHYHNTSLFLESLLRRDHFEKGHLVLRRRMCRFKKEVIDPQLERYRQRFERSGIRVDGQLGGIPDEDIPLAVDLGLISQVYANLFSNVEKYCQEMVNEYGQRVKFMSYGREVLPGFFGPGKPGIKFNVYSTGPHIAPNDAGHVFNEGFRAAGAREKPGTGHGLHFVKKVVEVHGGVVGYEPTFLGNNFFFVLPLRSGFGEDPASLCEETVPS